MIGALLAATLVCSGPVTNQRCVPSAGLVTPDARVPGSVELRIYRHAPTGRVMRLKAPLRVGPCTPVMR